MSPYEENPMKKNPMKKNLWPISLVNIDTRINK